MMARDRLLSPEEAAEILGVKKTTLAIWRCCDRYDLPFVRVGRRIKYRVEDVEEFIRRHRQER